MKDSTKYDHFDFYVGHSVLSVSLFSVRLLFWIYVGLPYHNSQRGRGAGTTPILHFYPLLPNPV